jgi:hypothetical protein
MSIEGQEGPGPRRRVAGFAALVLSCAAICAVPSASPAAVNFGSNLVSPANGTNGCPSPSCTQWNATLNSANVAGSLTAPISGVVVSFTLKKGAYPSGWTPIHIRVIEHTGGSFWSGSGASSPDVVPTTAGGLETFPVRVPISQSDYVGLEQTGIPGGAGAAFARSDSVFGAGMAESAPALPASGTPVSTSNQNSELLLQARVEPDADGDGFGDETQDACPSLASTQAECEPPETQITAGPKDKTRRRKASFEFSSTEPGSTFECSLDGAAFAGCTSPAVVKVKRGKHSFEVRATDAAGNVDGSPAADGWKVKKKKPRS